MVSLWWWAAASNGLHSYVSVLRQVLDDLAAAGGTRLENAAGRYRLQVADADCDALLFAARAAEGRQALQDDRPVRAADRLSRALALWRGPPLEDLTDLD